MNKDQLSSILTLLVPDVIKEIVDNDNICENEATTLFYESNLYSMLEDEETKLWHFSPKTLYELYKQEKQGRIEYPREQA